MIKHPCVILAGGKSSRMKKDKSLLPFGGYTTLAQFQYERLQKIFSEVFISSKNNKFDFECNLILENEKEFAPTFGLLSICKTLKKPFFIVPVDMPLVDEGIFLKLEKSFAKYGSVIEDNPLLAFYSNLIQEPLDRFVKENNHKLKLFLKQIDVIFVKVSQEKLVNLNYEEDYQKIISKLQEEEDHGL